MKRKFITWAVVTSDSVTILGKMFHYILLFIGDIQMYLLTEFLINMLIRLNGDDDWIKLDVKVEAPRGPVKVPLSFYYNNNWNKLSLTNLKENSKWHFFTL